MSINHLHYLSYIRGFQLILIFFNVPKERGPTQGRPLHTNKKYVLFFKSLQIDLDRGRGDRKPRDIITVDYRRAYAHIGGRADTAGHIERLAR